MDIKHSRRILGVGSADSGILEIIKDLTGSIPTLDVSGSTAGISHEWEARTAYYNATVPIWLDEVADVERWEKEFLRPEAGEVVNAVGAWLYCFRRPHGANHVSDEVERMLRAIHGISEAHACESADVVMLAVAVPAEYPRSTASDDWWGEFEDVCIQNGFESIDYGASGRSEFGEKRGHERLREALEANEWSSKSDDGLESLEFGEAILGGQDGADFGIDEAEMTAELFGLKAALAGSDPDDQAVDDGNPAPDVQEEHIEQLDRLMHGLLAVREQSAGLPEVERRRIAARAVRELMADT